MPWDHHYFPIFLYEDIETEKLNVLNFITVSLL